MSARPSRRGHGPHRGIKPAKDSTLAMLLAAQARGWELHYAEQRHLWLRDGVAWGRLAPLQVFDDPARGSRAGRGAARWATST
jgi:glutathione synthase